MTLVQIKAILTSAKLGSLSLAAKELNVSQSNISSYIKSVENEVGFEILKRGRHGVEPTDAGRKFLEHAQTIQDEADKISRITLEHNTYRLRVGSMNYGKALDVLLRTYDHFNKSNNIFDYQYHNVSLETGMEMLRNYKLDLLVAFLRESSLETYDWLCGNLRFESVPLAKYPFTIRLRKGHPLIEKGVFDDGTFCLDMLKDYPYVDYPEFNKESRILTVDDNSYQIFSYRMMIDGKDNRLITVSRTDGFCFGVNLDKEEQDHLGVVCYPIPNFDGYLNLVIRKGEKDKEEINQYISTFKESI